MQNPLFSFHTKANILAYLATYFNSIMDECMEFYKLDRIMSVFNFFQRLFISELLALALQCFSPSCAILHSRQPCSSASEE